MKRSHSRIYARVSVPVLVLLGAAPLLCAQEEDDTLPMEEVVVTGIRGSLVKALTKKMDSVNVVDSIESEDIGKFPDISIAESLQRLPGVTLDRSPTGDGRTINVRGLRSDFTRVEINGMGGATAGGRSFNFELLPSDLFTSATLNKTLTASDTEGGVAALLTMDTPAPFDLSDQVISLSAQENYGEVSGTDPRIAGIFSKQINDKFGILIGGVSFKNTFNSSQIAYNQWQGLSNVANDAAVAASTPEQLLALIPTTTSFYARVRETENLSGMVTLQFRPSSVLDIKLDTLIAGVEGEDLADRPDMPLEYNIGPPISMVIKNGVTTSGHFGGPGGGVQNRIGTTYNAFDDKLSQLTLSANWQIDDNWEIRPFAGYNERDFSNRRDLYSFAINDADLIFDIQGDIPNWVRLFSNDEFLSNFW